MDSKVTEEQIYEKFADIVAASLRIERSRVTMDAHLMDNLDAESLDLIEITMETESAFDVWLPEKSILDTAAEVFGPDILVQEGVLSLKLDGVWVEAKAGDLVRMPRGIPHGYFNKSDKPARALFWVSPMQKLEALFNRLHNLTDPAEVVKISAEHEVDFLPPEANA